MRKGLVIVLTFVASVGAATPVFAQSVDTKTWGVQAAVGIGYGTVPESLSREFEATFNGGLFAILPLSENWSFQPEVKLDKRKITTGGVPTDITYLSVPLLFRNKFFGIYMVQGVSLNSVVSAKIFDVDVKKGITSPDVAIVIGVGKRFGRTSIEGRWETGVRDMQKDIALSGVRLRTLTANVSIYLK